MKLNFIIFLSLISLISLISSLSINEDTQFQPSNTNTTFIFANNLSSDLVEIHSTYIKLDNNTFEASSSAGNLNITIFNFSNNYKKFNESKEYSSATINYVIGNFTPGSSLLITKNGIAWGEEISNSTGYISFSSSGGDALFEIASGSMPSTSSSSSSSSGGGSSIVTSTWKMSYIINNDEFAQGYSRQLENKERVMFWIGNETSYHHLGILEITNNSVKIEVASEPQEVKLTIGEDAKIDVTNDGYYDVYVKLNSINETKANLTIKEIYEKVTEENKAIEQEKEGNATNEIFKKETSFIWLYVLIAVLIIVFISIGVNKKSSLLL